jgi:hypothetical protein
MAVGVQVTFDCTDPGQLSRFWSEALGYVVQPPPEGYTSWEDWLTERGVPPERWNDASAAVDPGGSGPRLFFQRVPEGKVAKNRVHLDVNVGREQVDAARDRVLALGAAVIRPGTTSELDEYWVVMADPEGNEFCLQ